MSFQVLTRIEEYLMWYIHFFKLGVIRGKYIFVLNVFCFPLTCKYHINWRLKFLNALLTTCFTKFVGRDMLNVHLLRGIHFNLYIVIMHKYLWGAISNIDWFWIGTLSKLNNDVNEKSWTCFGRMDYERNLHHII